MCILDAKEPVCVVNSIDNNMHNVAYDVYSIQIDLLAKELENGYVKLVSLLSLLDSIPTAAITDP